MVFLKISQNSHEKTYARVSFLIKLQACNFIKKETLAQMFSCEFCEIVKNTFFIEHLWWLFLQLSSEKVWKPPETAIWRCIAHYALTDNW